MSDGFFLAAVILIGVQVQRESCDGLCQYPDTGVNGGHLHGGPFRHSFPGGAAAEEKSVAAAGGRVCGLIHVGDTQLWQTEQVKPGFLCDCRQQAAQSHRKG